MTTRFTLPLVDLESIGEFLAACCDQYEQSAPTVHTYCDDLYRRLTEGDSVLVRDLLTVQKLLENGIWEQPNFAANRIYHLQHDLGQDTTGQVGF